MNSKNACISNASFETPLLSPSSMWKSHGPFAFWLIENHKPEVLVELGTHTGFSYLCFCQQIRSMGLSTRATAIDTWQGDEHAGYYGENVFNVLKDYNDNNYATFSRLLRSSFGEAIDKFDDGSVDLLHIDGRHFYEDVKYDFGSWKPKLSERAIVLFHDTQVRRNFGVWRLWEEISPLYPNFEFFHGFGLGVLGVGSAPSVSNFPLFLVSDENEKEKIRNAYRALGRRIAFPLFHRLARATGFW